MSKQHKDNLILSGNGEVSGGSFQSVIINGNGRINGELECIDLECNGSAKIKGDIKSQRTVIKGNTKMSGKVHSEHIEIHGNATVVGELSFGKAELKGMTTMKRGIRGGELSLEGIVRVNGDCEVETADLSGAFTIDGLLNADQIAINLHGRSKVREIGGEHISVKRDGPVLFQLDRLIKLLSKELQAEQIEGDVVKLEYTKAQVVRGNRVEIGPGCEIGLVEYRDKLQVDKQAVIKETKKI